MGEGSSNQGDVHEALNFAAIHKLPFVFVVENNGYAISVPGGEGGLGPDVAMRASGYGIPGVVVDGTDVLACYAAAREAVDAGAGRRRPDAHRGQGDAPDRRTPRTTSRRSTAPRRTWPRAGRTTRCRSSATQLRDAGVLTDEIEAALAAEITALVEDATDYAEAEPDPDPRPRCATCTPRPGRPRRRRRGTRRRAPARAAAGHG